MPKSNVEPFCFRYLDEQLNEEENKQKFCELFELKLSKIELLKKQEVSPWIYKGMLEKIVATTKNDDLKMAAEGELDLDLGDIN